MKHPVSRKPRGAAIVLAGCLLCLAGTGGCGGAGGDGGLPAAPTFTPAAVPDNRPPAVSGAITTLGIDSTGAGDQSDVPLTFAQVFAQGDVPQASVLSGKLGDGTVIALQVDRKASHPDGSVRHAIISASLPRLVAGRKQSLGLVKSAGAPASATTHAPADLLDAGFTASVSVTLGGQVYSASADTLLKQGKYEPWLAGPIASEWLLSAPLKTTQGVEHPHLAARFAVRSYAGAARARVDVIIENDWAYEPSPRDFTYDVQIAVGGQTVYSKAALTHFHHARWRKTFWWNGAPQLHIRHDTAYLIASKAVPNYDRSFAISPAALAGLKTQFAGAVTEPMGNGLAAPYMPMTGGRRDIGLLPGWAVMYLLSMDKDAKAVTLGTADLAGSWSAHYRDKNTDRPVSLVDYPYMTRLGHFGDTFNPNTKKNEAFPECASDGACANSNTVDSAHQPGFAYLPYLVTGDHYYLEELQFWTMYNLFESNPYYRDFQKGLVKPGQLRGQAWTLRTLAEAAFITPDQDPFKAQFEGFLSHNLDWFNNEYTNNPNANKLGIIINGYTINPADNTMPPWMDDFFTSAIGHTVELGFAKAVPLLKWKAKFPIGRMSDAEFCWIHAAVYGLKVRDSETSPIYADFGQAYRATFPPSLTSLACASPAMAGILGLNVGEMTGYSASDAGYPSNMQPALAHSVDSGAAGGSNAWKIFMNRSVKPDYSNGPQFAIVPRAFSP